VDFHIIKETPRWIAIDKPPGIQVERNPFGASVESLVYAHIEREKRIPYVGIVHRLDRVTTGVVLVAKKKSVLRQLNSQFREKDIRKIYLAAIDKPLPRKQGTLNHWLEKSLKEKKALLREGPGGKARECIINFRIIGENNDGQQLVQLEPITGRYHQIRAQLAAIGCPVVGDELYGATTPQADHRIMLHAWKLEFFDEQQKDRILVEAKPPSWTGAGLNHIA
jgi:23S rRNA pseudouridine1911/1915/1917 synthase